MIINTNLTISIKLYVNKLHVCKEKLHYSGELLNMEVKYRTKSGKIRVGLLSTEIVDINNEKYISGVMMYYKINNLQ